MRNLARINNYYNRLAARNDWAKLVAIVNAAGMSNLVKMHDPGEDAGWRTIDKSISNLREAFYKEMRDK